VARASERSFNVGDWRVEPERDRISRGSESINLRPQVMELLVYLARHPDRVVSAEELLADLWTGKVVTGGTVYNCVAELRQALADGEDPPGQYIETIPKKGYRLLAPVTGLSDSADAPGNVNGDTPASPSLPWGKRWNKVLGIAAVVAAVAAGWLVVHLVAADRSGDARMERAVQRFTIDLPSNIRDSRNPYGPVTLTPDGRRVIFQASLEGKSRVFSRAIDSLVAEPIRGSERVAREYALSPDGEWIVFFDFGDGTLKKIPVAGGVPVILCDRCGAGAGAGAVEDVAWGANGDIVLVVANHAGLLRVSSPGGLVEELTAPGPDETHKQPGFSRDGDILFFTIGERGGTMRKSDRVAALSLITGEQKVLMAGASASMASDRHLLYFAQGTLWAVGFDAGRLEVTGEPVPVADDVYYAVEARYSVSGNGTLVYVMTTDYVARSLVWVDRFGDEEPVAIEPRPFHLPKISPDGQSIAVVVEAREGADLWMYSIDRGTSTRLTFDESREVNPVWSPDGRYVFYSSNRIDNLFRVATTGAHSIEQLTSSPHYQQPDGISPDGTTLFFRESGTPKDVDVSVLKLSAEPTPEPLLHSEFHEFGAVPSPDGRWLAYASNVSGNHEIYLRPYPDIEAGRWQVSVGGLSPVLSGFSIVVWDGSGKRLFYAGPSHMMSVSIETAPEVKIGTPEPLFDLRTYMVHEGNFGFDWHPQRERFLMMKRPPDDELPVNRIVIVQNWLDSVAARLDRR
jgi:serine/threonine-protein kinase